MLPESPGIEQDETLAEVVGFLEACQPRMVDLIEAGMQGMLGEELFSVALHVNDDLCKTLEAEKNGTPLVGVGGGGGVATPNLFAGGGGGSTAVATSGRSASLGGDEEELSTAGRRKNRGKGG